MPDASTDVTQPGANETGQTVSTRRPEVRPTSDSGAAAGVETIFAIRDLNLYYGAFRAVRDVSLDVAGHEITAVIGPSGCGKSTFIRCLNRMNDLILVASDKCLV